MADLTQSALSIFFTGIDTKFQDAVLKAPSIWWGDVATELPSDTELELHGWTDLIPQFELWVDTRTFHDLPTRYRAIVNATFANGFSVPLEKYEDDKHGLLADIGVRGLALQAAKFRDQQLKTLIQSNPIGFDGQMSGNNAKFFDTIHLTDIDNASSAPQVNDFPNTAFTPSNYSAVRAAMEGFLRRDGSTPYYAEVRRLLYAPALDEAVKNVLNSDFIAPALFGGQTQVGANDNRNVLKGTAMPTKIPEFANQPKVWYGIDDQATVRPFVCQKRRDFTSRYLTDPNAPNIVFDKKILYTMDARFGFDVTMWWYAIRAGTGL